MLAVDDSPLMRTFLQNKLQPYGISPEFASSGEEALFKISKNHFDMIFLDVMLPGLDGWQVLETESFKDRGKVHVQDGVLRLD